MANRVLVNENSLADIAAAIREKTGNTEASFTPGQMGDAIRAIEAGGGSTEVIEPVIEALSITANGVYTAPEGLDGYNPITVEIKAEVIEPVVESITITENGTYTPSTGVDGFNEVEVNIPTSGGADLPEEALVLTGNCGYRFYYGSNDWLIENYGSKMSSNNISSARQMFLQSEVERIPFELNFSPNPSANHQIDEMFNGASNLREVPKINNCKPNEFAQIFYTCHRIREYPEDLESWFDWSYVDSRGDVDRIFAANASLRKLPIDVLKHGKPDASYLGTIYYYGFNNNYALDEIVGLPITHPGTYSSNMFNKTFDNCNRLKEMTFALQEDGSPYTVNWSKQTIDLSVYVGYAKNYTDITTYNSGITADKQVTDEESYWALESDSDWFTCVYDYSRYNQSSAINTINSLPITTGTGCTIKFLGAAGELCGGSIQDMPEECIAVAADRGWTVSFAQEVSL